MNFFVPNSPKMQKNAVFLRKLTKKFKKAHKKRQKTGHGKI